MNTIAQEDNVFHLLQEMQQDLSELKSSVSDLTTIRQALVNDIELDNLTLEVILEVSDSTLFRWRNTKIWFIKQKSGHHYHVGIFTTQHD